VSLVFYERLGSLDQLKLEGLCHESLFCVFSLAKTLHSLLAFRDSK
jgi:hypothetical protein